MAEHTDIPIGDGTWAIRRWPNLGDATACAACGHAGTDPPRRLRWLHMPSGIVVCGGCRFTVDAMARVGASAYRANRQAWSAPSESGTDQAALFEDTETHE